MRILQFLKALPIGGGKIFHPFKPTEQAAARKRMSEGAKGSESFATLSGEASDKIGAFAGANAPKNGADRDARLPAPLTRAHTCAAYYSPGVPHTEWCRITDKGSARYVAVIGSVPGYL